MCKNREDVLSSEKFKRFSQKKKKSSRAAPVVNYRQIYPRWRENPRLMVDGLGLLHARGLDYSPWRYCHTTWLVLIFFGEHDGRRERGMKRKGNQGLLNVCSLYRSLCLSFSLSRSSLAPSRFPLLFLTPSLSRPPYIALSRRRG